MRGYGSRPRDAVKQRAYNAEFEALRNFPSQKFFPTTSHVEDYVRHRVQRDRWFKRTFGVRYFMVVRLKPTATKAKGGGNTIQIPAAEWALRESVVLHELAHCIRPLEGWAKSTGAAQAWHGREFAHTYLLLVTHFMGSEAGKALRAAFRKYKVKYTQPRQISEEQKEQLRDRLAAMREAKRTAAAEAYVKPSPDADIALARANVA